MGNKHSKNNDENRILKEEIIIYKNLCEEMSIMLSEKEETEKELRKEITQLRELLENMTMKVQNLE